MWTEEQGMVGMCTGLILKQKTMWSAAALEEIKAKERPDVKEKNNAIHCLSSEFQY